MDRHRRKHLLETFSHYLTGGIVLLKAFDKSEHIHEHPFIVVALFLLGGFIITATIFHRYFEKTLKDFKSVLHFTEFIVLCLVSYYYRQEEKTAIAIVYFIAAIGNLVASILLYRKKARLIRSAREPVTASLEKH